MVRDKVKRSVTLDAEIAKSADELVAAGSRIDAVLASAQRAGGQAFVPTVCLVESTTGSPRDIPLNRALRSMVSVDLTEALARSAAGRRAAVRGDDAADPIVVAAAAALNAVVLSTNLDDLVPLGAASEPRVAVIDPRGSGPSLRLLR